MNYRKFKADNLFTGYEMLDSNTVLITTENGTVETIIPSTEAGDDIESFNGILSPGFINAHCHLELSHMKDAVPVHTGLVDFVLSVIKGRHYEEEIIFAAIEEAEKEMIANGIVAIGDICNNTHTLAQKRKGNLYYHNFIEASGFPETIAEQRFERSRIFYEAYTKNYSIPIESNSIVPHAPYSVSKKMFELIANFPGNHILTMHNQENEGENELYLSGTGDFLRLYESMGIDISFFQPSGKRSLETCLHHFYKNQSLILVHNLATKKEDLEFVNRQSLIANENLFWCLCPNANLYISNQLPDIDLLIKYNCTIVTGTDSLASNHQLSILEELKTLQQHFPYIETRILLKWATINGAKALQLDDILGSFLPGKQPGVILIENVKGQILGNNATAKRIV